jgi:hypothetical protein
VSYRFTHFLPFVPMTQVNLGSVTAEPSRVEIPA